VVEDSTVRARGARLRARDGARLRAVSALVLVAALLAGAAAERAAASPYVHAHRGGALETVKGKQRPVWPEESLPAFRHAAKRGFVLEMDTRVTADGRVVLMHDSDLERTTACTGLVESKTLAEIRRDCPIDIVGTDESFKRLGPKDKRRADVPSLKQALKIARERGVGVNLEVNNYPTNPDYDASGRFQRLVAQDVKSSGFPPGELIVQSFLPPNLKPFQDDPYFTDAEYSVLTLAALNDAGPGFAESAGADWWSPEWPVSREKIEEAHSLGLRVVPFTLDRPADVKAATRAGADAIISNDPLMARKAALAVSPKPPKAPRAPSASACAKTRPGNLATPIESFHPDDSGPRVFALQFKQDIANVATYGSFRKRIECMIRDYVVPRMADDRPNVVALTEDVGLMTLATGSRGAETRDIFSDPANIPGCENAPAPCGAVAALSSLDGAYADQEAAYQSRFGPVPPFAQTFLAGTDTFARGWMQTFSDLADRYGVYILGSNNQAEFRESVDPADIAAFADPDVKRPKSAYVATSPEVYNEAFLWGPHDVTKDGPAPLRNVVYSNKKVPLTPIEQALSVTPGPSGGPDAIANVRPYRIPGTKARMSFATSLPAFIYNGDLSAFGEPLPDGVDPCSDTSKYYMYCLDELGTNLVMQDEANPGRWATSGVWQPLEWMGSTWRAAADPTVDFDYNVTPHMVGNLADLPFDGQTAITQRGLRGPRQGAARCNYVGNSAFLGTDPAAYRPYAGPKREFVGLAPWVVRDGSRERLQAVGDELEPGSGAARENDYVETAVVADLPYPPDPRRPNCNTGSVTVAGSCANLHAGGPAGDALSGTRRGDRILGLGGADTIRAGRGADCVNGGPGRDRIDCGPGRDVAVATPGDRIARSCERVKRR
jgi:glycerophosphoryl diester phosphodiesterase